MQSGITLSELQRSIKAALGREFPLPVWVMAEISELKVNYSGHCYIELIEKGEGSKVALAQCRAVIWRNNYAALSSYFKAQTGGDLAAGIKVLVKVQINFHELYGLSLQITDIDPTYTIGDAERERQLSIEQLKKDGVWDMNRSHKLGPLVQRLSVVSSANAAGYQDFCEQLRQSGFHFELTLFDAFMQGAGAEESIIAALEAIAQSADEFDAVVIIRGGGSTNDLRCFDAYRLASHVAQFPLPVFSGIGHDKDVSVVDMVSFESLKTPTAVASWLIDKMFGQVDYLNSAALFLHDSATKITHSHHLKLESLGVDLLHNAKQLLERQRLILGGYIDNIPQASTQFLELQKSRLEGLSVAIETYSPTNLMRLGYSVARAGDEVLKSVDKVKVGSELSIELLDGEVKCEVKSIVNK